MQSAIEPLVTVKQLSEALQVSKGTIYVWINQGHLPHIRLTADCVRFRTSDVQTWLEQHVQAGATQPE
jgi:excisionase family DNA binding protein